MLSTVSFHRERFSAISPYLSIYAAAAAAVASIYLLPGLVGALLGVSVWLMGMVPLAGLVKARLTSD